MKKNHKFCAVCNRLRPLKNLNSKHVDISEEHNTLRDSIFWIYYYCNDSAHCYKMIRVFIDNDKKKVVHTLH